MTLLGLLTKIKYSTTKHKIYPDGGRNLARTGMRNKLFSLHGLRLEFLLFGNPNFRKIATDS